MASPTSSLLLGGKPGSRAAGGKIAQDCTTISSVILRLADVTMQSFLHATEVRIEDDLAMRYPAMFMNGVLPVKRSSPCSVGEDEIFTQEKKKLRPAINPPVMSIKLFHPAVFREDLLPETATTCVGSAGEHTSAPLYRSAQLFRELVQWSRREGCPMDSHLYVLSQVCVLERRFLMIFISCP